MATNSIVQAGILKKNAVLFLSFLTMDKFLYLEIMQ
jgi:hypothetical protein